MRTALRLLFLSALLSTPACSHSASEQSAPRPNSDVITADEIRAATFNNVYDLVLQLRSRWLSSRGPDTFQRQQGDVMVRLDDNELGTVQSLRTLAPTGITSIRYVDPISSAGRWGLGYGHGAILISTQKEKP